jgi:hydrogenase-4 membrane subunit HyfE
MSKRPAVWITFTAGMMSIYLALAAVALKAQAATPADHAMVSGVWVALGAALVVMFCALFAIAIKHITVD